MKVPLSKKGEHRAGENKRAWFCPRLKVYGNIERVTQQKPFGSGDTTSLGGPS